MAHKFIFIVNILCFCFFSIQAQSNMEDVVYLKNGGVTRGTVLEIIPGKSIKIQTVDRNVFVYSFDEVIKVVKEMVVEVKKREPVHVQVETLATPNEAVVVAPKTIYKQEGFHNITKFGPLGLSGYSINIINGYQFNPYLLLGLGVGLDVHKGIGNNDLDFSNNTTDYFLPVYVDFRYHVSKSRGTFFMFMNMGYSAYLGGDARTDQLQNNNYGYYQYSIPKSGGTFFCPGIGGKVFLTKRVGLIVDFGFKFQTYGVIQYSSTYNYSGSTTTYTPTQSQSIKTSVSPVLNFGIAF